jgi:hypothetical protein
MSPRSNCEIGSEVSQEPSIDFQPCQGPCGGIAPDGGVPHAGGVLSPAELRRTRIAELRAAVIRAHPDHGGTTESLQEALTALRSAREPDPPAQRVTTDFPPQPRPGFATAKPSTGHPSPVVSVAQAALRAWAGAILASMAVLLVLRAIQLLLRLH